MRVAKALQNGLWNASSRVLLGAAQIIGSVLIVRGLNAVDSEAYGLFSYYATIAGLLMTLGVLAFPNALTKLTSELRGGQEEEEAHALARWLAIVLLTLNLLIAALVGVLALYQPTPLRWYLLVVAATPLFHVLVRILSSFMWGYETYRPIAIASSLGGVMQVLLIVVAYWREWGITGYLVAVVLSSNIIIPLILLILLVPQFKKRWLAANPQMRWPSRATLRRYFGFATPATLVMIFDTIIWQRSEVLFLEHYSSPEQIGYYSLGFSIFMIFVGLGFALINGYYPAMSREYGAGNLDKVREQVRQAALLAALFALPLTFGAWATMDRLIPFIYGEAMSAAEPVTNILLASLFFSVLAGVLGLTVNAINRIWYTLPLVMGLAAVNLVLDFLLIPRYGAVGGAVANSVAQLGNTVAHIVLVFYLIRVQLPWWRLAGLVVIAGLTTFGLPYGLGAFLPGPYGLGIIIVVAAVCYAVTLWLFGFLRPFGIANPFARRSARTSP